jgi:hypothetical protein
MNQKTIEHYRNLLFDSPIFCLIVFSFSILMLRSMIKRGEEINWGKVLQPTIHGWLGAIFLFITSILLLLRLIFKD